MTTLIIMLLVVTVAIAVTVALLKSMVGKRSGQHRYRQVPLMTENEREFFGRLQRALPHLHIFPQVAMSALIKPVDSFKENRAAYFAVNMKIVDFAVFTNAMSLVAIVELDDATHNSKRDERRDANTKSAGVSTLRWNSKKKPDEATIAEQFAALPGTSA